MNFKYYDLLSNLVTGVVIALAVNYAFGLGIEFDSVSILAIGYILGYFVNAVSALCEPIYYKMMGGMPSDVLLTPVQDKSYTGFGRIKFYQTDRAIELLRKELDDPQASKGKMFGKAMSYSNDDGSTRVPDFNAQYAFSRVLLTLSWMISIIMAFSMYTFPCYWLVIIAVNLLAFTRYKERGYYYAKEVLIEYIKKREIHT